jgi:predicted secreted protein
MAQNGRKFLVYWGGVAIAGGRSDEVQTECDVIPVSSATVGDWESNVAGRKSWSVTTGWLVANTAKIQELLKVGNTYTLVFGDRQQTGVTGTAVLKTCRITANVGGLVQGSFRFVGSGALSATT